jgi:MFS family permease
VSVFVASDLIPLRKRGVWQGVGNVVFGAGMAAGGVFGGFFNDTVGWRYAFYVQVPLTIMGGLFGSWMLDVSCLHDNTFGTC